MPVLTPVQQPLRRLPQLGRVAAPQPIAEVIAEQAGDSFDPDALPVLEGIFQRAWDEGRIDELGNGRFARSLFERACAARDLRVAAQLGDQASAADLTIVTAADLAAAVTELTGEPGYPEPQ